MAGPFDDNKPNLSLITGDPMSPSIGSNSGSNFDWSSIGSALIGSIPYVGPVLNFLSQMFTNKKNREWQEQMADKQNKLNLEQWHRENEYNSPSAQMARYIEAGLNPSLIYSQPNGAASSPNMVAPFETPNSVAPQIVL